MSEKSDDQNQAENDVEMNIDDKKAKTHQQPITKDSIEYSSSSDKIEQSEIPEEVDEQGQAEKEKTPFANEGIDIKTDNKDVDTHQRPVLLDSADIPCTLCDYKARTKKGISLHFRASHKNQMVNCSICPDFWTFDLSKYLKHCQTQKHKDKALTPGKKFFNVCHFDNLCKTEKMNKQPFINCLVFARNFI